MYRRISQSSRPCEMFRDVVIFYGELLLAHRPTHKLEDHPLSAVLYCLFNISAATLHFPLVTKFAGSNPAGAVGFFRAKKILSTPSFGREVKPFVPCRRFTACKRSVNVTRKSGIFSQNSSAISRPSSSSFHY